jgi:chitin disaccharide deacetylase
MKYLIVNADDFGASRGVNSAIVELHQLGVLTSSSLMIDMPAAMHAAHVARASPRLGVGLHVTLTNEQSAPLIDFDDAARCLQELEAQITRFTDALGQVPTHIDSHQNIHRDKRLLPIFQDVAARHFLALREHSPAHYFSAFYGQWDGETHAEQISIENLLLMLVSEIGEGIVELSCHPGYADPDFDSPYNIEREIELKTLSDGRFMAFIRERAVKLINFRDVPLRTAQPQSL